MLVEVPIEEEPGRAAFAFLAWRFSFTYLLAVVLELFEPPLSSRPPPGRPRLC